MSYPQLKVRLATPWYGNYNGEWTKINLPVNTKLETVEIINNPPYGRIYKCKVIVDGKEYTDMSINEIFVHPPGNPFILMPLIQEGGKKRKSRHRRKRRRSTRRA